MQSVSSRIWTRAAVSISYDDNDYTTGTSHVVMVCYCCWNRQEESVKKKGVGLYCSKNMWGRKNERMLLRLLYYPGKSSGQNGMNHSHWTKYINWNPNGKMIPALNNNLKFFLSATKYYQICLTREGSKPCCLK